MEEIESPTDRLEEELHKIAESSKVSWLKLSALLSALLAVLASIAGLRAGHEINEAMIYEIKASDSWAYYQAKGIKTMIIENQPQTLETEQKIIKYNLEQKIIGDDAKLKAETSERHLNGHEILAKSVTLFQVAIAMTAIAVLTRQKKFLLFSTGLGVLGAAFFAQYWLT